MDVTLEIQEIRATDGICFDEDCEDEPEFVVVIKRTSEGVTDYMTACRTHLPYTLSYIASALTGVDAA